MSDEKSFKALVVEKTGDNSFTRSIRTRSIGDLPAGELLIRVHWSSLNFKDALSATGHPGVTRHFPHTPGVDAAGDWHAASTTMPTSKRYTGCLGNISRLLPSQ